jgi:HAD superfamily hydrolase (TIGR01549 family)
MAHPPVEALTFDLDGTLCRYRRSMAEVLESAFEQAETNPLFTPEEYHDSIDQHEGEHDTWAEIREHCFADLAVANGYDSDSGRRVALAYEELRDHRNVEPLDGMCETLDALADYPMAIVTNGSPEMQAQKLEALDLDSEFEYVVHAGYDTLAKPDPAPFIDVLSRLDVAPSRAVHVGNSVESDVRGADAAGMRAAWLREEDVTPTPRPQYVLDSLSDLVELPWK